jgi:hypothetical protein
MLKSACVLPTTPEALEVAVEGGEGETHDVVVAAFDAFDAYHADPLLDAVGSGFVVGTVVVDVIVDFIVGERLEMNVGTLRERLQAGGRRIIEGTEADTCVDLMDIAAEAAEHGHGGIAVGGFAEGLVAVDDDGVGGDEDSAAARIGGRGACLPLRGFAAGEVLGDGGSGKGGVDMLVDVEVDKLDRIAQLGEELPTAGRLGG